MTTWTFHTTNADRVVSRCCAAIRERIPITIGWSTPGGHMRVHGHVIKIEVGRGVAGELPLGRPESERPILPSWDITIEGEQL